jgi:hypothetical protein
MATYPRDSGAKRWQLHRGFGGAAEPAIPFAAQGKCEPGDGAKHAYPAQSAGGVGDLRVVEHKIPLSEEDFPVAVTGADEKERAGACVGHVGADVEKVFKEPERAEGGTGRFAAKEEIGGAGKWDDEFEERATEDHKRMAEAGFRSAAENAEEWVSGFVDHQIGVVQEEKTGMVTCDVEKEYEIEADGDQRDGTRNGPPFIQRKCAPLHAMRVARRKKRPAGNGGECFVS